MGLVGGTCLDGSAGRNVTENCRGGGNGCIFLTNNLKNEIIQCCFSLSQGWTLTDSPAAG